LAKKRGWKVLATCSGRNADFVRETLGAVEVVDYTMQGVREEVRKFEPDAVIDNVGGTEAIGLAKRYVTIVGDRSNRASMGSPLTYYLYFAPRQWVRWTLGRLGLIESYDVLVMQLHKEKLEDSKQLSKEQIIIDSTFSVENAKSAYERLNTGRARGKVVVEVVL